MYEVFVKKRAFDAVIIDDDADSDDDEFVRWEDCDLCKQIRREETPGKILRAYRSREGLSIVELAKKAGIKYTDISAMEHDSRAISVSRAKRLGKALHCEYTRFLIA